MRRTEYKKRSTDAELKVFLKSNIRKDFLDIMDMRIQAIHDDLGRAATLDDVKGLQGELRGVQFWEQFPEELAKAILEEREDVAKTAAE